MKSLNRGSYRDYQNSYMNTYEDSTSGPVNILRS